MLSPNSECDDLVGVTGGDGGSAPTAGCGDGRDRLSGGSSRPPSSSRPAAEEDWTPGAPPAAGAGWTSSSAAGARKGWAPGSLPAAGDCTPNSASTDGEGWTEGRTPGAGEDWTAGSPPAGRADARHAASNGTSFCLMLLSASTMNIMFVWTEQVQTSRRRTCSQQSKQRTLACRSKTDASSGNTRAHVGSSSSPAPAERCQHFFRTPDTSHVDPVSTHQGCCKSKRQESPCPEHAHASTDVLPHIITHAVHGT